MVPALLGLLLLGLAGTCSAAALNLPPRVEQALLRGKDGTVTLDHREAAQWLGSHAHFIAAQAGAQLIRNGIHGHLSAGEDVVVEPADMKKCGPAEPTETVRIPDKKWAEIVKTTCTKYPICRDLGDGGVLGTSDFELRGFDGLIQFQITGTSVRLIIHGSEGSTNVATAAKCDDSVNAMTLKIYINDLSYTGRDMTVKAGWLGGTKTETKGIETSLLDHVVKLKLAVDARVVYEPGSKKWVVHGTPDQKGSDVQVCIPEIKIGNWLTNFIVGMFVSVKTKVTDAIYCAFKYTIPHVAGLRGLLDFASAHRELPATERPKIGVSFRNTLDSADKAAAKAQKYTAVLDSQTQFQMPTREFIKYVVTSAAETAKGVSAAPKKELSAAEAKDLEAKKAKAKEAGLDTEALESVAEDAQQAFDGAAKALLDEHNQAVGGVVESAANLIFGLENDLKGKYSGGFSLEKTVEGTKTDPVTRLVLPTKTKQVSMKVDEASLVVTAKDTKIPLSMFAKGFIDGAGPNKGDGIRASQEEIVAGRAVNAQDWERARSNAVLLSGDVDLYKVEDLEIQGNLLNLIGGGGKAEQYKANMRRTIGNEVAVRWFDAFVDFITSTKKLAIAWSTTTPVGARQHLERQSQGEAERNARHGDHSFRTIQDSTIDKKAIRVGGYLKYEGPFVVNKILKQATTVTNLAAQAIKLGKPRADCLAGVDAKYTAAMGAAKEAKDKEDKKCEAMKTKAAATGAGSSR